MSTQGHLIPRKMLEDAGLKLYDLGYYVYTGSHANTVRAVLNGEYDAGGIQDNLAKRLAKEGKIRIIKVSDPYPSSLICYNTALDRNIIKSVKYALLSFDPVKKHKNILFDWDKTEMPLGFERLDESRLEEVADLARRYGLITR
jgi:phosphonate transport system substrate-binding protein